MQLVESLLAYNPDDRISLDNVVEHPWFKTHDVSQREALIQKTIEIQTKRKIEIEDLETKQIQKQDFKVDSKLRGL